MSAIPDDIREAAYGVAEDIATNRFKTSYLIARAILAERKRCADTARRYLEDIAGCSPNDDEPDKIAAAIMDPDWQPPPL